MRPEHLAQFDGRAGLLKTGAKVLQSRMPAWQAGFMLQRTPFRVRFEWPGVVSVADDNTGEVLARSVPGQPCVPDSETRVRNLQERQGAHGPG